MPRQPAAWQEPLCAPLPAPSALAALQASARHLRQKGLLAIAWTEQGHWHAGALSPHCCHCLPFTETEMVPSQLCFHLGLSLHEIWTKPLSDSTPTVSASWMASMTRSSGCRGSTLVSMLEGCACDPSHLSRDCLLSPCWCQAAYSKCWNTWPSRSASR